MIRALQNGEHRVAEMAASVHNHVRVVAPQAGPDPVQGSGCDQLGFDRGWGSCQEPDAGVP